MLSVDLLIEWEKADSQRIDILAIADCDDVTRVTPTQIDGEFWVFVASSLTLTEFNVKRSETVFNIKGESGQAKVQIQPCSL